MAYTKNKNIITDRVISQACRAYRIMDGKTLVAENQGGNLTPELLAQELGDILENYEGVLSVTISSKLKSEKAQGGDHGINETYTLQLGGPQAAINGPQQAPSNSREIELIQLAHAKELEALRKEYENEKRFLALEAKLNEASQTNPYIDKILPLAINALTGKFNPPAIAGAPNPVQNVEVSEQEINERAENALARLHAIDKDIILHLEQLATLAETNKPMYDMALKMLPKN